MLMAILNTNQLFHLSYVVWSTFCLIFLLIRSKVIAIYFNLRVLWTFKVNWNYFLKSNAGICVHFTYLLRITMGILMRKVSYKFILLMLKNRKQFIATLDNMPFQHHLIE